MPQRNINLTPQQDQFVNAILESGRFANASEVFRAALRLLERDEEERVTQESFNRKISKAIVDYKNGDIIEFKSPEELDRWFEKHRKKLLEEWEAENN